MDRVAGFIKSELMGWNRFEKFFIFLLLPLIIILSVTAKDNYVATIHAVFGLLATIIAGKGKISCYFFGIVANICYSVLTFKNALYGNLLLNLCYYLPMQFVGIFCWSKNLKKENNEIIKTFLNKKERIILYSITILASIILGFILKSFNDQFPFTDAFSTVLSIVGMYLTVRRCIEQWIIWTIVNALTVIMWFFIFANGGRTFATLIVWLVYLFLGIYFLFQWKKELSEDLKTQQ